MENKPSEHFGAEYETLRQNILAHEATFRMQVSEVHCLYNVQKDQMALQCRRQELHVHSQGRSYPSPSGGIRRAQQVGGPCRHDMKKQSEHFMKGKNLALSLNRVSLRHRNSGSIKKVLELQVPADACADDSDDDMVMMWEPAKSLPINSGSVIGTNVKLNIEGSSRMNKNWIIGLQPSDVSTVNVFKKEVVVSSSTMKRIDFPSVGASSSQNQCYSLARMNLRLPSLEDNLEEKHVGAASDSKFFAANEEIKHISSYSHKKDGAASTAHRLTSSSLINPQMFAASSSNASFKSQWQSSSTDYTARRHYADAEMHFLQNDRLPTFQEHCILHSSEISGGVQYQKPSPCYVGPKDVHLNNDPRDANTTLGQASENIPMEISWVRNKMLNMRKEDSMKKSPVSSSCVNGHSQILPGSMAYSEGSTRVFGSKVSAATEKDSQLPPTIHIDTDITPLSKGVDNMEIQFQSKKDDTSVRNLIDLNVALPSMDDMERDAHQLEDNNFPQQPADPSIDLNVAVPLMDDMVIDARQSDGDVVPQEPYGPFTEAPAITAADNLMVMHEDEIQAGAPGILHWFADLAVSWENMAVYNSGGNNGDYSKALTVQLFETRDSVYSSAPSTQGRKSNDDQLCSRNLQRFQRGANSVAVKPPKGV